MPSFQSEIAFLGFLQTYAPASFVQASIVGKSVMIVLASASVWSWALIGEAIFGLVRLKRAVRKVEGNRPSELLIGVVEAGDAASRVEIRHETVGETRARLSEAMSRKASALLSHAERGLPTLAIVASVSPFVGLFGTVYGIMTSFASIAYAKDTSLAVVAPGIAEALGATAWGLVAAIPAAIAYNRIVAALGHLSQRLSHLIEERAVKLMVERQRQPKESHKELKAGTKV